MDAKESDHWRVIFKERPKGAVTVDCFRVETFPAAAEAKLAEGQVEVKLTNVSVDPYMRSLLNAGGSTYSGGYQLDQPCVGGATGMVVRSNHPKLSVGDHVNGMFPWVSHVVVSGDGLTVLPSGVKDSLFLGAVGMPGLTALISFKKHTNLKPGNIVFVSGAAGAVGSVFGQIAKNAGCIVYGSAGAKDKTELLKSLNFDDAFNYKELSPAEGLDKLLQGRTIDMYFDNVGGETLDQVMPRMTTHGMIVCCGMISQYEVSDKDRYVMKNMGHIVGRRLTLKGILIGDWAAEFKAATLELVQLVTENKVKPIETVVKGFRKIPEAFVGLFEGKNVGKMIIQITDD